MKIKFDRIWEKKQDELKNWLFHNVLIGLSPVLLSFVFLMFGKAFSQLISPFLDGTLLIFTATLSGASMSFFVTETKLSLRKTERAIFRWLLAVIIFGACGYTAIIMLKKFSPESISQPLVFIASSLTLGLAIYFNLFLAGVRSVYTDHELLQEMMAEDVKQLKEEKKNLVEKARDANEVDGAKL